MSLLRALVPPRTPLYTADNFETHNEAFDGPQRRDPQ